MAAFEFISKVTIQPHERESILDFRSARLPSITPPPDGYDPRQHRVPRDPIKLWMAYFNILRILFGPGMLGLPLAISQGGIILGPLLVVITGIIIIHMHMTLLWCLNEISRQLKIPYISYRYGFRMALLHGPPVCEAIGHHGPSIIAMFMILSQIGICTVSVIFTADNLRDLVDWQNSNPAMLTLLLPFILFQSFTKTLKIVSYISLVGNVLNVVGLILILYHIFMYPHGHLNYATKEPIRILFVIGSSLFNLSAVGVILSLEKNLPNPTALTKRYGVLNIGMFATTVVSTIIGALGYWSFGYMQENVIRSLPYGEASTLVANAIYLVAVSFTYPIQCYPAIQIFLEVIKNRTFNPPSDRTLTIIESIARPIFVAITFFICYLVPFQGPFVAFVGNLCTTVLALVFPALMELCLLYPGNYGKYYFYLIKDMVIIAIGLLCWLFGSLLFGYLLYHRLLSKFSPENVNYL